MAREIKVSFALDAALSGNFGGAFKAATGHMQSVTRTLRDMEATPVGRIGAAMTSQREKIRGLGVSLREARGNLDVLNARATAAGGASGILARQIQQAETRVTGLTGQLHRQNAVYRETVAEAATVGGSVKGLSQRYQELTRDIEAQRQVQARAAVGVEISQAQDSQRAALRGVLAATPGDERSGRMASMYMEQREALRGLGTQLRDARQQLATLRTRANEAGGASGVLARQIQQAEENVSVLNRQVRLNGAAFRETVAAATAAGGSVRTLSSEYRNLTANAARAQAAQEAAANVRMRRDALRQQREDLRGRLAGTVAQVATVVVPVKLAIDFESSMADVKKVTDFDDSGFKAFSQDLLEMSSRLPLTAKGLSEIAAAAGAAGIQKEELLTFTADAAKMGVAFDISAQEAGAAMTGLRNNFKLSQDEVRLLGDAMNTLSNSMDAKAAQLVNYANRAGGTAKLYGMTGQEVSALGAAFLEAKVGVEEASTSTNAMLVRLGTADKLSADAQEAFKALGMSGEGMAAAFKQDAQGALLHFLQTVKNSDDPMRALNAILGAEHAPKIARLVGNLDGYSNALGLVSKAEEYQGATNKEYASRAATTANNVQLLQNSMSRLGITIGNSLMPVVSAVTRGLSVLATGAGDLAERFPTLTATVTMVGGAIAGLAVGTLVWGLVSNTVKTAVMDLGKVTAFMGRTISFSAIKTKALTAATYAWNAASRAAAIGSRLLAGGIRSILIATGVGAALVGLGLAADWVISHWESVGPVIKGVMSGIADLFTWGKNTVMAAWAGVSGFFSGLWQGITDGAASAWGWVSQGASTAWGNVSGVWNGAAAFFTVISEGIANVFSSLFGWLEKKFAWVISTAKGIAGTVSTAWNAVFGDDDASGIDAAVTPVASGSPDLPTPAARVASSAPEQPKPVAPVAVGAPEPPKPATQIAAPMEKPSYQSRADAVAGLASTPAQNTGKSGARGGGRAGSGAGSFSFGSGGPVTVVSLAGDNSTTQTVFIPAGSRSSLATAAASEGQPPMSTAAGGNSSARLTRDIHLPQAGMNTGGTSRPASSSADKGIAIDLKQYFDLGGVDSAAVKKAMDAIKPDMEALVRRTLDKLQSNMTRTRYAQ